MTQTKVVRLNTGEERVVEVGADGGQKCCAIIRHGANAGNQCTKWALRGATVCPSHGGQLPQVKSSALVRNELSRWGLLDAKEDPGEVLLRLVAQSSRRVNQYSRLLEELYEQEALVGQDGPSLPLPAGIQALIGATFSSTAEGRVYKTGEQIRGLVRLESEERDRCASMATKAIAAGLAERQVRIAEQQGQAIIEAIQAALDAAGVKGPERVLAQNAAAERLLAIAG